MDLTELRTPETDPLRNALISAVRQAENDRPRSLQRTIGPSSAGEPCTRRLAYQLMGHSKGPSQSDPWAAIVGTAVHAWLADALISENKRLNRTRWIVEQSIPITDGMLGSCDALECDDYDVVDHKVPGATKFKEYVKHGPSLIYQRQADLYGYGYTKLGVPVKDVCIAFYPRAGRLSDLYVWRRPYREENALETLDRLAKVTELAVALEVDEHPDNYRQFPKLPGDSCRYCPWYVPGPDTGRTCPGDMETH